MEIARHHGTLIDIDRHVALVPVTITDDNDRVLRRRDPLPVPRRFATEQAVKGIKAFAWQVKGTSPPDSAIPRETFPKTGALLTRVKRIAHKLPQDFTVRIVDKGAG